MDKEELATIRNETLGFLQANLEKIDFGDPDEPYDTIQLLKSDEGIQQLLSIGWIKSLRHQSTDSEVQE